jgi:hypothetical protein
MSLLGISREKAQKAQRGVPQPKPSIRNVSRRGAENAEKYQEERSVMIFSAFSAPLREKIFAGMRDSGVLR